MPKMKWSELKNQQLGRYGEYYAMMEFASYGCDIYSSQVDDSGIDFVTKINDVFYEVQVKSVCKSIYTYILKSKMQITNEFRLVCYLRFSNDNLPEVYIIPATAWQIPNAVFLDRDYETGKSKPEWGINDSQKHRYLLTPYLSSMFFNKSEK